jgi:hypothetical protein
MTAHWGRQKAGSSARGELSKTLGARHRPPSGEYQRGKEMQAILDAAAAADGAVLITP